LRQSRRLLRVLVLGAVIVGFIAPTTTANATPSTSAKSIQQQITDSSNSLEKIVEQYDGVHDKLTANKAAEIKLTAQIAPTLKAVDAAKANVSNIVAQAYMAGPASSLGMLVTADNTSDLLNQISTLDEMAVSQQRQLADYQRVTAAYNAQKRKLDSLIATEAAQQKSLAAQKATINTKLTKLYALRAAAYGSATTKTSSKAPIPPYVPGRGGVVVKFAYAQIGKPYVWAADGPGSYDCSGLVLAAYAKAGVSLPHNAAMQWGVVHHIPRGELSPGDLVFYDSSSIHHVAIYIGSGKVIHAPTFGDHVKISGVDMMRPWGYGRP
jgi:cell wall-associated NlpC family hydrolase